MCLLVETLIAAQHATLIPLSRLLAGLALFFLEPKLAVASIECDHGSPYLTSQLWL